MEKRCPSAGSVFLCLNRYFPAFRFPFLLPSGACIPCFPALE